MMTIDIIGGGSLGLLYGGRLASSGVKVRIWCRSQEQALCIKNNGLILTSNEGEKATHITSHVDADVIDNLLDTWRESPADWIFLMTKQKDVENIGLHFLAKLDGDRLIDTKGMVCFQNGTGHIKLLQSLLPKWHIYSAITTEGARKLSHHEVFHAGSGVTTIGLNTFELLQKAKNIDESEKNLVNKLRKAGFDCNLSNEIHKHIYRKLLINAIINPLTALWRIQNGELLAIPTRVQMMRDLFLEAITIYESCGIYLEDHVWEQIVNVCLSTSANTSSMLKDILDGVSTEVKWINGSIVAMAEENGLIAHYHRSMVQLIEGISAKEE